MKAKNVRRAVWLSLVVVLLTVTFWPASSAKNKTNPSTGNLSSGQDSFLEVQVTPAAQQALATLQAASTGPVVSKASLKTGVYNFVRATNGGVLMVGNPLASAEARARAFLNLYGAVVGMSDTERSLVVANGGANTAASTLSVSSISTDAFGFTHVKLDQKYKGLAVFGAQLVVHMNSRGITAVNGDFVPGINVRTTPKVSAAEAAATAVRYQIAPDAPLSVSKSELSVYRVGLLEGHKGSSLLAYNVEVTDGKATREQIWIDAIKGTVLNRISLNHKGLDRIIYTPEYGEPFDVRHEGDPLTPGPTPGTSGADPVNNLYVMAGHTYNLFRSGFGRDSYDGLGHTLHSVYLVNDICPNAYWNGISTNYCPDFDADDVVSHEWGHAYTQFTHDLIYSYQSGALNESYSDIFGETADLLNGVDAEGGSNNSQPMPTGQRWQIGEDVNAFNQPVLGILRDMWTPTRFGDPDRVSSPSYACGSGDGGGVHTNSGVPNHAFAMLVDGKTFNNQTVGAIGFTRALAIYYRAMTVYQTRTTDFAGHEAALLASCNDLIGQPLNNLSTSSSTSTVSSDVISSGTCQQVQKAMLAVEMSAPIPCPASFILDPDAPAACDSAADIFVEDWETGDDGWTRTSTPATPLTDADWNDGSRSLRDFSISSTLPGGRTGSAAYAPNIPVGPPGGGTCAPDSPPEDPSEGDYSGQFTIDSPVITIPTGATDPHLRFDHYLATENGYDGVQLEISVNGGAFALVAEANYIYNSPNSTLTSVVDGNTNPNAGEAAWTGTNVGPANTPLGSWGTTIVDLASLTAPGDSIRLRFTASQDGCNGVEGWYIDNIRVYNCVALEAPDLSLGGDYQNPDPDGSYTLNWTRPAGATGPDVLQESSVCGALLSDDAENGLGQWTVASSDVIAPVWQTSNTKPQHSGTSFWANPVSEQETQSTSTTLTFNNAIQIPATGITTLDFSDWYFNESDDKGAVEVSTDNGTTWTEVDTVNRNGGLDAGATALANEPLKPRQVDLTIYSGQTIRLRFKYSMGQSNFFVQHHYGWYVDNISITNDSFHDVVTTNSTSYTVTGRAAGSRCYRVRTSYDFGSDLVPSPYSNQVTAVSSLVSCTINFAHSSHGSTASASSTFTSRNYSPEGAINGDVIGAGWEQGGGWNDATRDVWPDWLEVDFHNLRTIREIRVYTLQNNFKNPVQPDPTTPADLYGIRLFDVQYWNGTSWVTIGGFNQEPGNDKAMSVFTFADVQTSKIRVFVNAGRVYYSRIVEVEAIGCPN